MQLLENISLKPYNTFGMDVSARYFTELNHTDALQDMDNICTTKEKLVIGGGSNILLTKNVDALLIKNNLKGRTIIQENDEHVWVKVMAGEVWHELVIYTIAQGWSGLENLSLIPGCVGAAPMQNIGAYGVEVKDVIDEVSIWLWEEKSFLTLKNKDCQFGYRDSIFKHELKGKGIITSVTFKLCKQALLNISYGAIQQQLEMMKITEVNTKVISDAVIAIRSSKLPNPKEIGNAGSFFKNPTIPIAQFNTLKEHHTNIPSYPVGKDEIKIPAGWLIEQNGWKGYRKGDAGVHAKQALVLVNYGTATGVEIWNLSSEIVASVNEKYGITLEREVQVW